MISFENLIYKMNNLSVRVKAEYNDHDIKE